MARRTYCACRKRIRIHGIWHSCFSLFVSQALFTYGTFSTGRKFVRKYERENRGQIFDRCGRKVWTANDRLNFCIGAWLLSWKKERNLIANKYCEHGFMSRVNTCFVWKYYDLTVPCEQSKNTGRFRVNKVSSQIVQQMENSTVTALTYSLRVSFFTDIFPLK